MGIEELLAIFSKQAEALKSAPVLSFALTLAGALIAWLFKHLISRGEIRGLRAQLEQMETFKLQIQTLMVQLDERLRFANDKVSELTDNLKRAEWNLAELRMNIAQNASADLLEANTTAIQSALSVASVASEAIHEAIVQESTQKALSPSPSTR